MRLKMLYTRKMILYVTLWILTVSTCTADYAPTGCSLTGGSNGIATCDFAAWSTPLDESDFGPEDVLQIIVENVDGTIPNQAFSGIDDGKSTSRDTGIKFECNLENIILSTDVFTSNLNWMKYLTFKNCYVQDGISSGMLSHMTSLEEFTVDGGIIGPLSSDVFSGLTNLKKITINADFLDTAIPSGLFTSLSTLEEIDLKSAGISSIAADTFTNLGLLTKIDLSENSLTTLPEGLFTSLISLSTVELGTNSWNCTCDLSWLSTWSLYTGVSIDVTCTTPAAYSGISLSRVVASIGCIDSLATTATTGTSSSSANSDDTDILTYVALGGAGFAFLLAFVLSIALCCVYKKLANSTPKLRKKPTQLTSISTIGERPPSYRSNDSDRMFVSSPVQTQRDSRVYPFYDVNYKKPRVTSVA